MKYKVTYETRERGVLGIFQPTDIIVETETTCDVTSIREAFVKAVDALHDKGLELRFPIDITAIA